MSYAGPDQFLQPVCVRGYQNQNGLNANGQGGGDPRLREYHVEVGLLKSVRRVGLLYQACIPTPSTLYSIHAGY